MRVATTDGTNLSAEARIYVHPTPISQIIVDYDGPTTLKVGQTAQLSARVLPETATDKSIKWMVQSGAVLNVSEDGLVTAVGLGTAWAGAFADNESVYPYAVVEFTVVETPVERIGFEHDYITVRTGEQSQINAIVYPSTATNKILTWDSNDSNIATVDNNGVVTGVNPGQIDINARATDGSGVLNAIRVIVREVSVESISIDAQGMTKLKDGETLQLVANILPINAYNQSLTWSSSDEEVATVSEAGLVTAHAKLGQVIITATASNGVKDTLVIEVIETPVETIELQCNSVIKAGEVTEIRAVVFPKTATNQSVIWSIENTEILRIRDYDSSVLIIEAMQPGQSLVYATSNNGVVGACPIKVLPILATSISLNKNNAKLKVGETFKLEAKVLPENVTNKSVKWTSSRNEVLTVNEDGLITALKAGTCDVTASTQDGSDLSAVCTVTVVQPVTAITLSEHDLKLYPNNTFSLIATIEPIDASDKSVKWTSLNPNVAEVDENGAITTNEEGETIVSVSTLDGSDLSDECIVTVKKEASGVQIISLDEIKITVNGNRIFISGLKDALIANIYTTDGLLVSTATSNDSDIVFNVAPNTCYILKVGKSSLKLYTK